MTSADRKAIVPFLRRVQDEAVRSLALEAGKLLARFSVGRRPVPQRRIVKAEKRLTAKVARQAVRLACVARAMGACEACGRHVMSVFPAEFDHFYGRAFSESVETCWMLGQECHRAKTENRPSREHWDGLFRAHCEKHGYAFKPRYCK